MANTTFDDEFLRRLEKGLRDQQASFQATRDDVTLLKQGYGIIQRDLGNLTNAVEKLLTRFEENRKTNWPLLAMLGGMLPLIIGGGAFFVSSYSATSVAPVHVENVSNAASLKAVETQVKELSEKQNARDRDFASLGEVSRANSEILNRLVDRERDTEQIAQGSRNSDTESKTDRSQLNNRMTLMESRQSQMETTYREQSAVQRTQLAEVESQFHSVSNLENLRAAQQERLNAMLWEKSHPGERYPNGTFFPTSIFQGPASGGAPTIEPPQPQPSQHN